MSNLPSSWVETNLGSVVPYGATVKAEPEDLTPDTWVLELEDIEKDTTKVLQRMTFSERQSKSTKNQFDAGDVLYGKLRPYLNKVTFADQPGVCSTEIVPIKPTEAVEGRYMFYWLRHPRFLNYVTDVSHGVNMPRLGTEAGRQAPFVLAPKTEQKRIADKLDTILTRLDAVNARLARVAPILKRFRQSVLAAATSGRLTEDWRVGRDPNWEQPLFAEIVVEACTGLVRSASEQFAMQESLVPYLKMNALGEMWGYQCFDLPGVHCSVEDFKRYELRQGDWLFNTRNSVELVGKSCVWTGPVGVVFNNNLLRVRFRADINPMWVEIFFRSPMGRSSLGAVKSATTSVAAIYQRSLMGLPILQPPEAEQTEIVRRVETLFAFADRLEARLQAAQTATERLTPSLLAKAFRGELVPQDPNDEPASELLKRLAATTAPATPKRRGRVAKAA